MVSKLNLLITRAHLYKCIGLDIINASALDKL